MRAHGCCLHLGALFSSDAVRLPRTRAPSPHPRAPSPRPLPRTRPRVSRGAATPLVSEEPSASSSPAPGPRRPPPRADDAGSQHPAPVHIACPRTGFGRLNTALPTAAALLPAAQVFAGPFAGNEHPPITHQVWPPPSLPFLLGKIEHPFHQILLCRTVWKTRNDLPFHQIQQLMMRPFGGVFFLWSFYI